MRRLVLFIVLLLFVAGSVFAQLSSKVKQSLYGHVVAQGEHLSYATVAIRGSTYGTTTDATGHYRLRGVPAGQYAVVATCVGYKPSAKQVTLLPGEDLEVNFTLEPDLLNVEQVVVTSDRFATTRRLSSTIVNTVSPKLLQTANAVTISEGLSFIPGVRMENNCQNCGFNQVRLNGLEGAYSQVLVDGQPIFSGLMGVYGMELIPSNMIERLEIQRGGGSTLYGSNAVAGTVNIILQDPSVDAFEVGFNGAWAGLGLDSVRAVAPDYSASFNASTITDDNRTGLAVYGNYRYRSPFDLNGDGYSEYPLLSNTTLGARFFQHMGMRGKLSVSYFHIGERRRGGNAFDLPAHEADVAEAPEHQINSATTAYTQFLRDWDKLSFNASFSHIRRHAYYGGKSLRDYGLTKDLTYSLGAQYQVLLGAHTLTAGLDMAGEALEDMKPGYSQYTSTGREGEEATQTFHPTLRIAEQRTNTVGVYAQHTYRLGGVSLTGGVRTDYFRVYDRLANRIIQASFVPVPRASILYDILPDLQLRLNYSMGYRAPQLYNEELHVGVSGAKRIVQRISDDLRRETSHSGMLSLDFNRQGQDWALGLLAEGFYTKLIDAFISKYDEPDEQGLVVVQRSNYGSGAWVAGVNLEMNLTPTRRLSFRLGGTYQRSQYSGEVPHELNYGQKAFVRTPDIYGFVMGEWRVWRGLSLSSMLNVTGPMRVVYEGVSFRSAAEKQLLDDQGFSIRTSPWFADMQLKANYEFRLGSSTLSLFAGVKNLLHSYQGDFDRGSARASSYVYGPLLPRTAYAGVRLGNLF